MLTDDGKHLYVSWDEYHMLIERLALKVAASQWKFDQILCPAACRHAPGTGSGRTSTATPPP